MNKPKPIYIWEIFKKENENFIVVGFFKDNVILISQTANNISVVVPIKQLNQNYKLVGKHKENINFSGFISMNGEVLRSNSHFIDIDSDEVDRSFTFKFSPSYIYVKETENYEYETYTKREFFENCYIVTNDTNNKEAEEEMKNFLKGVKKEEKVEKKETLIEKFLGFLKKKNEWGKN